MSKMIDPFMKIRQLSPWQRKAYTYAFLLASLMLVPDLYFAGAHHLLEILHVCYEGACYLLEELIGHSLHLDKYHSQLILFYVQVSIVLGLCYKLWRAVPRLYSRTKENLQSSYQRSVKDSKELWSKMPSRKRIKVLAGCAAGMFGIYFWVTS
ncbi:hypothetical protein [Candidatus Methylomicrobium oryzae]|jgi:hypothetical protein|uniref:hypothetical protein n=1 Tax=Candidatus Methylomicrobium oryzae TaxID=2802053 RepID=UPI0019230BD9|nr:hypothetical protein [Methylomicrobium sp. RS1]MBL1262548.1 hypothetical protein [Methylomicrobium sp. RS1]